MGRDDSFEAGEVETLESGQEIKKDVVRGETANGH